MASPSGGSHDRDLRDEDFLPAEYLNNAATPAVDYFTLDSLEAEIQAEVQARNILLQETSPGMSSGDLLANSAVLRAVIEDQPIPSARVEREDRMELLEAENERLRNNIQELEMDLALEKQESQRVSALAKEKGALSKRTRSSVKASMNATKAFFSFSVRPKGRT